MNPTLSPEELRHIFLSTQESDSTRLLAVACSFLLFAAVLWLVRRRDLQEEYTPIWIVVAFSLFIVTIRLDWLHALTRALGAWTTSSTVFFLGEFFLVAICLNYAVRLSRASMRIKNLAQELTLLKAQVDRLESTRTH